MDLCLSSWPQSQQTNSLSRLIKTNTAGSKVKSPLRPGGLLSSRYPRRHLCLSGTIPPDWMLPRTDSFSHRLEFDASRVRARASARCNQMERMRMLFLITEQRRRASDPRRALPAPDGLAARPWLLIWTRARGVRVSARGLPRLDEGGTP